MSNIKSLAEEIIQLTNRSNQFEELVTLLKSSDNTIKDDIEKLIDGAKLECKVDINKIKEYSDEIESYRCSVEDDVSSAYGSLDDATSSLGYLSDEICGLSGYLDDLTHELKEDKKEKE